MTLRCMLTAGAVLAAAVLPAAAIEGEYRVVGQDLPPAGARYTGVVEVQRTGDTYQVAWIIGEQVFVGTGLRVADSFGVVYETGAGGGTGSAVYEVRPDGRLIGVWTMLGGDTVGTETWTPEGQP